MYACLVCTERSRRSLWRDPFSSFLLSLFFSPYQEIHRDCTIDLAFLEIQRKGEKEKPRSPFSSHEETHSYYLLFSSPKIERDKKSTVEKREKRRFVYLSLAVSLFRTGCFIYLCRQLFYFFFTLAFRFISSRFFLSLSLLLCYLLLFTSSPLSVLLHLLLFISPLLPPYLF